MCNSRSLGFLPVLSLLLQAMACVPDFEDDLSQIAEPRLLAIQAFPAEAEEGEEVTLEALVATAEPSSVVPSFQLCIDRKPLTELGPVSPACLKTQSVPPEIALPLGKGSSVVARVPLDACRLFGPQRPEPKPGEPAGRPVDPDLTGGFFQPVIAWLDPGSVALGGIRLGCGLSGVARDDLLDFTARYRKNENPSLAVLQVERSDASVVALDETSMPPIVAPEESLTLRAGWAACPQTSACGDGICGAEETTTNCGADCTLPSGCSGAESYVVYNAADRRVESRREQLVVSWYTTGGRFESERTGPQADEPDAVDTSVRFTAPSAPGPTQIWAVIRDDRGGVGFRAHTLTVARP